MPKLSRLYPDAIAWIAWNDNDANRDDVREVSYSLTAALVADVFGVSTDEVGRLVIGLRQAADARNNLER